MPLDSCIEKKKKEKKKTTRGPVCAFCCTFSTDGARVKDTNEPNETEGKTAPEIYTTGKHLRD